MNQKNLKHFLFLLGVLFTTSAFSQSTITGTVSDEDGGEPLIGVNILIKGTTTGTITDFDGNYSITANTGDVLVFSYTGFAEQESTVGASTVMDIVMAAGSLLDEVVVVGYGSQKKATVTGAVAQLKGDILVASPSVNLGTALAGRLPGLVVIQNSGRPGDDNASIRIRGTNTLGNSDPLIVIDGIPDRAGGLSRLLGQDIESVSVLKDASAAIYGARAANGAIIVTTKQGKAGKTKISYSFNQGWSQPTVVPTMSNAVEYANIMNELPIYRGVPASEWGAASASIKSTGTYDSPTAGVGSLSAQFSPAAVAAHGNGSDPWGFPDSDWFGATFREWAPQQVHHLGISGGSEDIGYYASLGFTDQDAIYNNSATFYKQYSGRINLNAKLNNYVKANLGMHLRREDRNNPTVGEGAIFRMLMRGRPNEPAIWPNGLPGPDIENGQQPVVVTTNATGYERSPSDYIQFNGSVDITNPWIDGLKLTLLGSADKLNSTTKLWQTPWELFFWDRQTLGADGNPQLEGNIRSNFKSPQLSQSSFSGLNTNVTAMLNYDKDLDGGHKLNVLAGVTQERFEGEFFSAFRRDFISPAIDQLFAGGAAQQATNGSAFERARLGYYGRVQYNFQEKYLAEFIWRYDGSYIFPRDSRFGFFPGLLLGWNVSQEPWFNVGAVDHLKLRTSYGEMGNDQVFFNGALQEFAYLSTYGFNQFPVGNQVVATLEETALANPNFTWERAKNFNFGLDASLFGRLDVILEYFNNNRDQILIQKTGSTPASSGISTLLPPENAGEVRNQGFEFSLTYNGGQGSDLKWSAGVNGGFAQNEVIFLDEVPGAPDYQRQEGNPIGSYIVYEADGAFIDQAAIEANTVDYSAVTPQLIPGDLRFNDVNGDGKIDGDDQVRLNESIIPKFNFGATFRAEYKGFDFSILLQGATGAKLPIQTESGDIGNFLKYSHDNRWSIDNPSAVHPRLASRGDTYYTGGNFGNNTYFLFDKDYIRIKNIELGYNLTGGALKNAGLENLRVFVNAFNLVTWAKQDIYDPEVENGSGTFYPQNRVLNFGFNVTF
ncbi:MAG: SusC/RagA family TonB-linked outer membrane protein [Saprospiraceae bacterium]